jgi:putative DNA primase/helicase
MDARSAARALGGEAHGNKVSCPGPGHKDKGDRSLSVTFDPSAPDGFLVHSFSGDDFRACRDHVRAMLGLGSFEGQGRQERPVILPKPAMGPDPSEAWSRERAGATWQEARSIHGTIAEKYLAVRGIDIPEEIFRGRALRFHPACPFRLEGGPRDGKLVPLPALVAAVVDVRSNEFLALHRTALTPDGNGKANMPGLPPDGRKMFARSKGGVVKLTPDEEVTHGLGIAEGLETALSVMGNYGFRPMWATLSTSTMAKFPVLPGIEFLTIWADNDTTKASGKTPGIDAARECGARWAAEGAEGEILTPPMLRPDGTDFNDLVQGRAA